MWGLHKENQYGLQGLLWFKGIASPLVPWGVLCSISQKNCLIPTKQEIYDWKKFMGGMERNLMLKCWCLNSIEDLWACSEIYVRVTQMIWYHCNTIALKSTITYQKYLLQDNKCIIIHNLQMKQKWFTLHCALSEPQNAGLQHTTWSLGVWPSSSV